MEADVAYLEIFESKHGKRYLREPAIREETSLREAVTSWAHDLSTADHAPFEVTFRNKYRGHEHYVVSVGARRFTVIVH